MKSWPKDLRQTVLFMMAEIDPVILYWGEHDTMIYNEAYIPLVGKQHPELQGKNAPEAFPDFWDYFDRILNEQRLTGETRVGEASMLLMERSGFLEETYFNWRLIPVIGEDGLVLGSYSRSSESTNEIISCRRVACVQSLSQQINNTSSFDDLWKTTMNSLTKNDKDIPMAMLYTLRHDSTSISTQHDSTIKANRKALLGVPEGHRCAEVELDIQKDLNGIAPSILSAFKEESLQIVRVKEAGLEELFQSIEWRGYGSPSEELLFLPIKSNGTVEVILVIGLSPHLSFTSQYQEFIQLLGDIISPQITKLRLAEEVKQQLDVAGSVSPKHQTTEMRFSRFADRSPLGMAMTDSVGRVVYANEAWHHFTGLSSDVREFPSWIESVFEDDMPVVLEWWHKVSILKQGGTFQTRSREPFVSGTMKLPQRTGIVSVYPDLDDDGNVATVMGFVTDISELKWAEEQLRLRQREVEESENKYRSFAEHAPIGVVRTDVNGYVLFANDTWRSFYNIDRDHKITEPEPWLAALNKEDAPLARQFFQEMRNKGNPHTVEVRLKQGKTAKEANRASPTEFWLLSSGYAEYNPDGSINNLVFWVTDISDQKAAERVLTNKMEEAIRLRNTQEHFVDMISHEIRNPLSAILHCGEEIANAMKDCLVAVEKLPFAASAASEDVLMLSSMEKHIDNALDAANTIMYCVQHQKQIVDDVLTLSKLDADLLVVSPIPVQPYELLRSALKIFEPELKASAIELCLNVDLSLQQPNIDWILLDSNRFLQIVINLVTNAIKFTQKSLTRRVMIDVTAQDEKPPRHHQGVHYVPRRDTDRDMDENILDSGTDQPSPQDLYLCFRIADTGKGLTEAECTTLFNRFAQASPKTHIEYGGSGLGLFISRQITEMLGGEIGVGSESGKGATFAFYVRTQRTNAPRQAPSGVKAVSVSTNTPPTPMPDTTVTDPPRLGATDNQKAGVHQRPVYSSTQPTSKRRVLVVEDNLINQKVLCKQLRNRGFVVDAANHGREALDALEKIERNADAVRFDIVLCDIEMPVMGGIECVSEIRRLEKEDIFKGHIPIIGVTANVRSKQVNAAIEAGMDGVTTKPYRIDELIAHIDRVSADIEAAQTV